MDFHGQKLATDIFQFVISLFAVVGLVWGYINSEVSLAFHVLGVGLALALILTVPPWGFYRRHTTKWLPALYPDSACDGSKKTE